MPSARFSVKYSYGMPDKNVRNHASFSGAVNGKSEALVMQKLKDKHKGCEVALKELKWK